MTDTIEKLASALRVATYNAYSATLIGANIGCVERLQERMAEVKVGDIVVETSTIYMAPRRSHMDGIGILLRDVREPVNFGPDAEPWDEVAEGRPHPTERVVYIQTFDGREFRWENASFISVPSELIRNW
jgi:hypothetical protein